jgi:hypothetical protein
MDIRIWIGKKLSSSKLFKRIAFKMFARHLRSLHKAPGVQKRAEAFYNAPSNWPEKHEAFLEYMKALQEAQKSRR